MTVRFLCLPLTAFLIYLFLEINARPEGRLKIRQSIRDSRAFVPDPGVIREMKKFKLEVLKSKILNEINLPEPPVVQTQVYVPKNMLKMLDKRFKVENVSEDKEELIMYPYNDDLKCKEPNGTICSRFKFEMPPENLSVSSLFVWIHKVDPSETLFISFSICTFVEENDQICDTQEVFSDTRNEFGWTLVEIPAKMVSISKTENRFYLVEAYGTNVETTGDQTPFLVVYTNSTTSERKGRSSRSVSNKVCTKECCKMDFYISFKDIGWHFVVAPEGFHANMCYGKCITEQLNAFPSRYHRTMNRALANKTAIGEKKENSWTPCCSPTNLKPLIMIYKAPNDTIANATHSLVHHEIPDMIAESCGCW